MQLKSIFVMAILLVSAMTLTLPMVVSIVPTAYAATGNPKLGAWESTLHFAAASTNVSVPAGSSSVFGIDQPVGTTFLGYFDINFSSVTFTGGQFFLYVSTNGLSQLSSSDVNYSGPFSVSQVTTIVHTKGTGPLSGFINVTISNPFLPSGSATFSVGNDSVIGPAPVDVPGGQFFVKAFDGSSTSVAVSVAELALIPGITISPTQGPAGITVTVTGSAFSASSTANVTVSAATSGNMPSGTVYYSNNVTTSAQGTFTYTFTAPELFLSTVTSKAIFVTSENYVTSYWVVPQTFTELARMAVITYFTPSGFASTAESLNATLAVPGYVTEPIMVTGYNFNPSGSLSFTFNGSAVTPSYITPLNGTGFFNATFNVPVSPHGVAIVAIKDASAPYLFKVGVVATLVPSSTTLTPGQKFTLTGYAFTASSLVNVTWIGLGVGNKNVTQLATNTSVGSNGEFTLSLTVPSPLYGGGHIINASDLTPVPAYVVVNVTATVTLSPTTAPLGSSVSVSANGLPSGTENVNVSAQTFSGTYSSNSFTKSTSKVTLGSSSVGTIDVVYDNALTPYEGQSATAYGVLSVNLTATGYPELHFIQLYAGTPPSLLASEALNVTGSTNEGTQILNAINSLSTQQTSLMNQLNSLSSSVSSLSTSVSNGFSSVQSSISSLSSTMSSDFSSVTSSLSSISGTLGTVQSNTAGIATLSSSVSNVTTYLLVAIVLAAIVLILEIVILVRKK